MGDKFKSLKGFINKQVSDVKFRLAGSGRRLNEEPQAEGSSHPPPPASTPRVCPTDEAQRAGQAALIRLSSNTSQNASTKRNVKAAAILKERSSEVCPEKSAIIQENSSTREKKPLVYFHCPLIGPEVLTRDEWIEKMKEYLDELISTDQTNPCYAAVLIKSVNSNEKAKFACEKLKTCLQNILDNPEEEKYKKIRANNQLFKDKLLPIYGCEKFLLMSGFNYVTIDDIEYLMYQPVEDNNEILKNNIEALNISEPIPLVLDRSMQVIKDSSRRTTDSESDDFFQLTKAEVKMEATKRQDEIEDMKILKTRAMREKSINYNYNTIEYALIKIKFPDGLYVQGRFGVNETINDVKTFVLELLKTKSESFNLLTGVRHILNPEKSLIEEKLIPAALLYFEWNKDIASDNFGFLSEEIIALSIDR